MIELFTYLCYMSTWADESNENITQLIEEHALFLKMDNFEYEKAVDSVFDEAISLAKTVRDLTVAADVLQIEADAAAVASVWTFGFGIGAFIAAEVMVQIDKAIISSKSEELNKKLESFDTDIAKGINSDVQNYVATFKKNHDLIIAKAPKGLDTKHCRTILLQFMAEIYKTEGKIDCETFRKYARSCSILFNSPEINAVYVALDKLNLGKKEEVDKNLSEVMKALAALQVPTVYMQVIKGVQGIAILSMGKWGIPKTKIQNTAEVEGIEAEVVSESAFARMNALGKFAGGLIILISIIDIYLSIRRIFKVVEQCNAMVHGLEGDIKTNYKAYFQSIREASRDYKKAVVPTPKHILKPLA